MLFGFGFSPSKAERVVNITYDADAQTFFTNAGITDTTQKNAVNQLVLDLKSYNIWTKMTALYPIIGGNASAHAVNLKTPGTYNLTFSTGWTHASTGMTPNGSAYADSGLTPSSNLTLNSSHLSYYSRTTSNGTEVEIGARDLNNVSLLEIRTTGVTYGAINSSASYTTYTDSDSKGMYIMNRTASNVVNMFKNNSKVATGTTASLGRPTYKILLGAFNGTGTVQFYSVKQCAFASIGDGLTDTDAANFYTAVQAFQTTLSRNV